MSQIGWKRSATECVLTRFEGEFFFQDANLVRFGVGFAETPSIIADPVSGSIFFEDVKPRPALWLLEPRTGIHRGSAGCGEFA